MSEEKVNKIWTTFCCSSSSELETLPRLNVTICHWLREHQCPQAGTTRLSNSPLCHRVGGTCYLPCRAPRRSLQVGRHTNKVPSEAPAERARNSHHCHLLPCSTGHGVPAVCCNCHRPGLLRKTVLSALVPNGKLESEDNKQRNRIDTRYFSIIDLTFNDFFFFLLN